MSESEKILIAALERMIDMHNLMMEKVNHGANWYDAQCLREMNEAPIQACRALKIVGATSADVDRSHKECVDCSLEHSEPPQCKGHAAGPVACGSFVSKG